MADVVVDPSIADPSELTKLGVRAYMLHDYDNAISAFSRAIELIVAEHGDKHDSLGTVYLYYGKTLLELSRDECEPLGDAVPRQLNSESEDEEVEAKSDQEKHEEDEKNKEVEEKKAEVEDPVEANEEADDTKKVEEVDKETDVDLPTSSTAGPSNGESSSSQPVEPDDTTEEKPEEEPTDLQVAWEVLELAKIIFESRGSAGSKDLAETLIVLGDVSLESENFENAVADTKRGLDIQKTLFKSDSRHLAETYYKLAIAHSTNNQIDEAVENFKAALDTLNNRIVKLKENPDLQADEIKDIETLMPEIQEKIADMMNLKEEVHAQVS